MEDIAAAEDFIKQFHNLEGATIANKRQNFGKLLHNHKLFISNSDVLNHIFQNLKPTTYLEELFKLDFLIYFRKSEKLINILLEGKNDVFVKKISKQWWLFEKCFKDVDPDELLTKILPCVSFSVRMKILKKVSQVMPSEKFQAVFEGILKRYGTFVAMKFILGCTVDYIKKAISVDNIKLTQLQLQKLYQKDPNLISFYLINTKNSLYDKEYSKLLKFLYINDSNVYGTIMSHKSFQKLQLGKRVTRNFVKFHRADVIQNSNDYLNLKFNVLIRKLGKDSTQFYRNMLPETVYKLYSSYSSHHSYYINKFPKKYHYNLYFKITEDHLNFKHIDHIDLVDQTVLRLIKDNSERALYAKKKVEEGLDEYIKYLLVEDSIPLLQEKINYTSSIHDRGTLIKYLVASCAINNDTQALIDVMKYFNQRHKNDDISVHLRFIRNIEKHFGFKNFTEEMWQLLNDLLLNHRLKHDKTTLTYQKIQTLPLMSYNLGTSLEQKLSYMAFLFQQNKPIDNLLEDYFISETYRKFFTWGTYDKAFEKHFLLFAVNRLSNETDYDKNLPENLDIILELHSWNRRYKDDPLSFFDFPSLYYTFVTTIKTKDRLRLIIKKAFTDKIFTNIDNEHRQLFLDIYWQRYTVFATAKHLEWFLKHDLLTVSKYFESFVKAITGLKLKFQVKLWYNIKKLDYLHIGTQSKALCLSKINEVGSVLCLSVLLKPLDFAALSESYKPPSPNIDKTNSDEVRLLNIRSEIAKSFTYTKNYETLPHLLHYCTGVYFKSAVKSLYSLLFKTPENLIPQYLTDISKCSVSIRKHSLYLTCALTTVSEVETVLNLLNSDKKSQFSKKKRFTTVLKYFLKNPNDKFFAIARISMFLIKTYNEKTFSTIMSYISTVPQKYKNAYVETTWKFIDQVVKDPIKLTQKQYNLVDFISEEDHEDFPLDFGLHVIQQLFQTDYYWTVLKFALNFVAHQTHRVVVYNFIFAMLDKSSWKKKLDFFRFWYEASIHKDEDLAYLDLFIQYFEQLFRPENNFRNYVKVNFLKMRLSLFSCDTADEINLMADAITAFASSLSCKYGALVESFFAKEMDIFLDGFKLEDKIVKWDVFYKMICDRKPETAMLLLRIIDFSRRNTYDADTYHNVLREMMNIEDLVVQLYLHIYCGNYIEQHFKS